MPKKILVVLTSVEKYPNPNRATGLWLGEAGHFVKKVEEASYVVHNVSPIGGLSSHRSSQSGDGRHDGLGMVSEESIYASPPDDA